MKRHISRVILVVAILALVTAFSGSASAAGRHHHHPQVPRYSAAPRSYAPRVCSPYPNFSGYGGSPIYGGYVVPHHSYHHSIHHGW